MAKTYSQIKSTFSGTIPDRTTTNSTRLAQARSLIAQAVSDLGSMQTEYSDHISSLATLLAADPTNPELLAMTAAKDFLISDFQDAKTLADALIAAYDAANV